MGNPQPVSAAASFGHMADMVRNDDAARYEAWLDGEVAGFAEFQLTSELIVFTHTQVNSAFEGQGVGSALAKFALDDVRADGTRKVLPLCLFIKAWIDRHPGYISLVYGAPPSTAKD